MADGGHVVCFESGTRRTVCTTNGPRPTSLIAAALLCVLLVLRAHPYGPTDDGALQLLNYILCFVCKNQYWGITKSSNNRQLFSKTVFQDFSVAVYPPSSGVAQQNATWLS